MNSTEDINGTWYQYYQVWCIYPVSGAYTRFQRILSATIIMFVLFFQLHNWLTAAGVAFLAAASTTAAIHAVILSFDPAVSYDADYMALSVVLQSAAFSALLCMMFSPRFLDRDAKKFYQCWLMLLAIALLFYQANSARFIASVASSLILASCDDSGRCNHPCANLQVQTLFRGPPYDQLETLLWASVSDSVYLPTPTTATGSDPTSTPAVIPAPAADDSSSWTLLVDMIILSLARTLVFSTDSPPVTARNRFFLRMTKSRVIKRARYSTRKTAVLVALLWLRCLWKGVVALIFPLVILSAVFRVVVKMLWRRGWVDFQAVEDFSRLESKRGRVRHCFAKTLALAWYCWAYACYLVAPAAILSQYVRNEMRMDGIPESEGIKAVGQWSPWVAVGILFLVAVVNRAFSESGDGRPRVLLHSVDVDGCRHEACRRTVSVPEKREKQGWRRYCRWFLSLHLWPVIRCRWEDFKAWWKDPLQVSLKTAPTDVQSDELLSNIPYAWERLRLRVLRICRSCRDAYMLSRFPRRIGRNSMMLLITTYLTRRS